jgi:hypothetical protein
MNRNTTSQLRVNAPDSEEGRANTVAGAIQPVTDLSGIPPALRRPIVDSTPGAVAARYRHKQISDEARTIAAEHETGGQRDPKREPPASPPIPVPATPPPKQDNGGAAVGFDCDRFIATEDTTAHAQPGNNQMTIETEKVIIKHDAMGAAGIPAAMPETVPDHLTSRVAVTKPGRGISTDSEDSLYPYLTVLQPNTPMCNSRSADYIAGAEAGNFYLRGLPNPIRDGEKGIEVIVWAMGTVYKEWKANRGGLVATRYLPPAANEIECDISRSKVRLTNGNECVFTKQLFLLINNDPFEMPLASTQLTFHQNLNTHFEHCIDAQTQHKLAIYAKRYLFYTKPRHNAKGEWFGLAFKPIGWVSTDEYDQAERLADAMDKVIAQRNAKLLPAAQ